MRLVLIDLGSGSEDELFGKDIIMTDAPEEVLKEVTEWVWKTPEYDTEHPSAEENFFAEIVKRGYQLEVISCLDDIEVHKAIGQEY